MSELPPNDRTPIEFSLEEVTPLEALKKQFRKFAYPLFLRFCQSKNRSQYSSLVEKGFDDIFVGQRGNDYENHRRRLNRVKGIEGSVVLIIGIGTGKDLNSWLAYRPKKIIAVDYFDYSKAWEMRRQSIQTSHPELELEFKQMDVNDMKDVASHSVDIICSDAVFEHLRHFDVAVKQMTRVLAPGGVLYSNFGPLWHSWGGDHISGSNDFVQGYNHIDLEKEAYEWYIDQFGEFDHSEHDGRTWIKNDLFSYLKMDEYIQILSGNLKKVYLSCIVDEKALRFKQLHPEKWNSLEERYGRDDLLVSGMAIFYEKHL